MYSEPTDNGVTDENNQPSGGQPSKMFIYGSCVTRDCLPYLGQDFELVHYTARQSLVSSASEPGNVADGSIALESAFQQRQVRGDVESSLFSDVRRFAGETDVMVMDIVDERLGVRPFQNGYVTVSAELSKTELMSEVRAEGPLIALGEDRHFLLWARGVVQLARTLHQVDLLDSSIVFDTPWATTSSDGREVPPFRDVPTPEMNVKLRRYYDYLESAGLKVVKAPDDVIVADAGHQWGVAPFHYVPAFYEWMSGVIRDHAGR